MLTALKQSLVSLQHTRYRNLLSVAATARLTARYRKLIRIYLDKDGDWVSRQPSATFFSPGYMGMAAEQIEADTFDIWSHYHPVQSGEVLVDIGAGIGDQVVYLSRAIGSTGRLVAIEAHPRTFSCLKKTITANRLDNVLPMHLAISDAEGQLNIEDDAQHISNRVGFGSISVPATTLDSVLDGLDVHPTVVKMNIEGAEVAALKGATHALASVPRWIVSCHDFVAHKPGFEALATLSQVQDIFRAAGFTIRPLREDDARPWVRYYVYAERS